MIDSDKVSVEWVLDKLHYSDAPRPMALGYLEALVNTDKLYLYFENKIRGVDVAKGYENVGDSDYPQIMLNGKNVEIHEGSKYSNSLSILNLNGSYLCSIGSYKYMGQEYYSSDETGTWLEFIKLELDEIYFDRKQALKLASSLGSSNKQELPSNIHSGANSALKALALLSKDMAEKKPNFRCGSNVNAIAMLKHIHKLANEYLKDEKNPLADLKSIDDLISNALNKYDLKSLNKQ